MYINEVETNEPTIKVLTEAINPFFVDPKNLRDNIAPFVNMEIKNSSQSIIFYLPKTYCFLEINILSLKEEGQNLR